MKMFHFRTSVIASIAGTAIIAANASAQDPGRTLPPLEVVATRVPKATHDVPASIEVITAADLASRGVKSLKDALSLAAGISIAPGGDNGPASAVPEFWGLREFDAFLLVVDDVPWGGALNPAVASLDLHDVERIEILRGPAPVTYGATSFVGVIHVVHKSAAAGSVSYAAHGGSFGSGGASGDLVLAPIGAWKTRISADFDRLGFKDDRTSYGRGHALLRTANVNGDNRTWLTADIDILRQNPASPHPRDGASLSTATPLDANYNPKDAYLNTDRFTLSAGLDRRAFGSATWGSMVSFTKSTNNAFRGFLTDITANTNNATGFKEGIELTDIYADTHIIWAGKSAWTFMTGADILFANGEATGATFDYSAPLNGLTVPVVAEPTVLPLDAEDRRIFLGAYASAEWRAADRISFTGGVRMNSTGERRGEGNPTTTNNKLSGSVGTIVGLWEKGADHLRLFANYRNTFKPAAFDFGLAENEGILKPETSSSYEGGVKFRAGKFDMEASAFHMDFENLVVATIVNNLPALANAGKTRYQGIELAADLQLQGDLHARATYSYHDGKFVDYQKDFGGTLTQLAGKRVEMSANDLASAGLTWAPATGLNATAALNFTGSRYLNQRNTALSPSFTTIDAGVGYRFGRAEVRVDGRNLGNSRDPVSESEFGDAQYYRMTARSILVGVSVRR
ncbi:MAG: TonB-dependent receptor, partial [Gemmatimonadota bacterium]